MTIMLQAPTLHVPTLQAAERENEGAVLALAVSAAGLMLAAAWLAPMLLPAVVIGLLAAGGLLLVWRHLTASCVAWVMVTGLTPEMTLTDLIGPEAFAPTIAAIKGTEIGLVTLMILRFGPLADRFNPAWAFAAMAVASAAVGMHPELTPSAMVRSLIGSITPFLLFFCVKPRGWGEAMRRAIAWIPLLSVVLGGALDLAGIRPLFVDSGGARLAALGHPAFLAGVCLPALYAGLLRWLRTGAQSDMLLPGVNGLILILTGARAPVACAAAVFLLSLMFAPAPAITRAHRLIPCLAALAVLPMALLLGQSFSALRLFTLIGGEAGHLSGRDLLWPLFEAAAGQAPWFGWGPGAGNLIIDPRSQIAQRLHTWAAHNEYLRLRVEGGYVGGTLLIVFLLSWATARTRRLPSPERLVTRLILAAFAIHAVTDNVLISSPACVFFAFVAAVCADEGKPARGLSSESR